MKKILILFITLININVFAEVPVEATLIARANIRDGFALPAPSFITNVSPVLNNQSDVAFEFTGMKEGRTYKGMWLNGKVIYENRQDLLLSKPSLNDHGDLLFNLYSIFYSEGIYLYKDQGLSLRVNPADTMFSRYSSIFLSNDGDVKFRGENAFGSRSIAVFDETNNLNRIAREGVRGDSLSYIFAPQFSHKGFVAAKVRKGDKGQLEDSQPDEIRLWNSLGSSLLVDTDEKAEVAGFQNGVGISDLGHVVYVLTNTKGKKELRLYYNGENKVVAKERLQGLANISNFSPVVNSVGVVAFRGTGEDGKAGIYIAKDGIIKRVVREGSLLFTDRETARILDKGISPGFAGGIDLNDKNELVFNCVLTDKSGEESLGHGIYLLKI